jgi:hypothetical protein
MSDTTTAIAPIISATDEIASQFMAILFLVWCGRLTTRIPIHGYSVSRLVWKANDRYGSSPAVEYNSERGAGVGH